MVEFNVSESITVEDFFKNEVTKVFEQALQEADLSAMAGKLFTLQFNIEGKKYCLKVQDGKSLEVVEGGIDQPMIELSLTEKFWRDSVTGKVPGAMDQFTDPQQAADINRYNALIMTKGTLNLELKQDDGSTAELSLVFQGQAEPQVTLRMDMTDWVALQRKEVEGPTLFMGGKMQFEGDMMFLMALQNLM